MSYSSFRRRSFLFRSISPLLRTVDNARLIGKNIVYDRITGKLSYTYWKSFEEYDKAWGLTEKYNGVVRKISREAAELDRQYKIRANAIRHDPKNVLESIYDLE